MKSGLITLPAPLNPRLTGRQVPKGETLIQARAVKAPWGGLGASFLLCPKQTVKSRKSERKQLGGRLELQNIIAKFALLA